MWLVEAHIGLKRKTPHQQSWAGDINNNLPGLFCTSTQCTNNLSRIIFHLITSFPLTVDCQKRGGYSDPRYHPGRIERCHPLYRFSVQIASLSAIAAFPNCRLPSNRPGLSILTATHRRISRQFSNSTQPVSPAPVLPHSATCLQSSNRSGSRVSRTAQRTTPPVSGLMITGATHLTAHGFQGADVP